MARFLVQRDGLFLGSSSAVNLVACIKLVRKMGWGNGEKIVTVLCVFPILSHIALTQSDAENFFWAHLINSRCDSGARHYSKVRLSLWARPPCFPFIGANGYKQKITLNLMIVLVRSFLRTFLRPLSRGAP